MFDKSVQDKRLAKIPATLVSDADVARKSLNAHLRDKKVSTADELEKAVKQKIGSILLEDEFFFIEKALCDMLCKNSEETKLHAQMLTCTPNGELENWFDVDVAAQKMHSLNGSDLFKLSSRGAQGHAKIALRILTQLVEENCPDITAAQKDTGMSAFCTRLANLCTWKEKGLQPLFGKAAAERHLKNVEDAIQKDGVDLDIVKPLKMFHFLLEPEARKRAKELIKARIPENKLKRKGADTELSSSGAASSSADAGKNARKEKGAKAYNNALNMFRPVKKAQA